MSFDLHIRNQRSDVIESLSGSDFQAIEALRNNHSLFVLDRFTDPYGSIRITLEDLELGRSQLTKLLRAELSPSELAVVQKLIVAFTLAIEEEASLYGEGD